MQMCLLDCFGAGKYICLLPQSFSKYSMFSEGFKPSHLLGILKIHVGSICGNWIDNWSINENLSAIISYISMEVAAFSTAFI